MNISGIRTYAGFYDYNTIRNNEARSQQIQEAKEQETASAVMGAYGVETTDEQIETSGAKMQSNPEADTGAMEYAKQYQPEATYDLKGVDSDIASLDIEKAISDMKKDQVLQQYQFFIGEKKAGEGLTESRENENFSL